MHRCAANDFQARQAAVTEIDRFMIGHAWPPLGFKQQISNSAFLLVLSRIIL